MTLRQILVSQAVMVVLLILFMGSAMAGRTVPVQSWCKSPDVFKRIIAAHVEKGMASAIQVLKEARDMSVCVILPDGVRLGRSV